jgi:uncharacterized membrane protein YbhN (UPF0104 family)
MTRHHFGKEKGIVKTMVWTIVRIGVAGAVLALIIFRIDIQALGRTLADADPTLVAAGALISFVLPVLAALRWRLACRIAGIDGSFREHMAIQWIAGFVGQGLPSSVGVEGMRIWLYTRRIGGIGTAVSGVIADRVAGLVALLILVVAGYSFQSAVTTDPIGRLVLTSLAAGALVGLVAGLALLHPAALRLLSVGVLKCLVPIAQRVRTTITAPGRTALILLTAMAIHGLTIAIIALFFAALGPVPNTTTLAVMVPAALLILVVPLSIAGWGLREGAFVFLFGFAGVPVETSLAVSILFGLSMIASSLPGGLLLAAGSGSLPGRDHAV